MANEWTVVELLGPNRDGEQVRFAIADGIAISIGTLCSLTDPRTTGGIAASGGMVAGVAAEEKNTNDGTISISLWTQGRFEALASGAIAVGGPITPGVSNTVITSFGASGAAIIGTAQETGSTNEVIEVRLNL